MMWSKWVNAKRISVNQNNFIIENKEDFRHNSADPLHYINSFEETMMEKSDTRSANIQT